MIARLEAPFPAPAQLFLAAARLQEFDGLPKLVDKPDLDAHVQNGCLELNRGLTSTPGISAAFYVGQLALGKLYPGTVPAHGHGVYFAEPSVALEDTDTAKVFLPRRSLVAEKYASGEIGGLIVRAALKPKARTIGRDDLFQIYREEKNRAARAGVTDFGTFAALTGYDAFYIDHAFTYCDERMWIVLNRTQLVMQRTTLRYIGVEQEQVSPE